LEGQLIVTQQDALERASAEYVLAAEAEADDAYRLAGYILGDAAEAQDAVQEASIKAWRSWSSLRDRNSFGPWFQRIVVNVCRDRMRRHSTLRMVELDAAGEVETDDIFRRMVADDEVAGAVARLDREHRIVIVLRFWQDLALEQVADRLDLPVGTVKSRLHYALKALRTELRRSNDEA
jgi:RNA polymerase sigma-70 factor (ECF subfamily)